MPGDAGEVGGGDHRRAGRRLDAEDPPARHGAAHERPARAAPRGDIRRERAVAAHERAVLAPRQRPGRPSSCGHRPLEGAPGHHCDELATCISGSAWMSPNGVERPAARRRRRRGRPRRPGASPTSACSASVARTGRSTTPPSATRASRMRAALDTDARPAPRRWRNRPGRRLNSTKPQRQLSSRSGRRTSTIISSPREIGREDRS